LEAIAAREKALHGQLRVTEAELTVKTAALAEVERKLTQEKAELNDLIAFVDARDKLAETESRHAAALENVRAQNRSLEEQLGQSFDECIKIEQEMASMKRQVEATWATERMANAVLRERINDVAGEVVRVAHALEGLGSPIETMLAGKASELAAALGAVGTGNGGNPVSSPTTGGEDSKGSLAYRIRSLQKRAARVASDGGK
jgi:chromosome segregation ATPase